MMQLFKQTEMQRKSSGQDKLNEFTAFIKTTYPKKNLRQIPRYFKLLDVGQTSLYLNKILVPIW